MISIIASDSSKSIKMARCVASPPHIPHHHLLAPTRYHLQHVQAVEEASRNKAGHCRKSSDGPHMMGTNDPAITYRYLCEAGSKPWPEFIPASKYIGEG